MNDAPQKKKRTWLWIVLGVFFLFIVVAVGGIIFSVAFVRQSMSVTGMSPGNADQEFEAVRAKFGGRQPLIQMIDGQPQYVADSATTTPSTVPLKTMHVMAWDDEEGQLVTFSLPFWLLRMKSGPIRLSAYSQGLDDRGVTFRIEDLERHGPGLVLDMQERTEGRVLIWAE
jgi:hypothetical protein